MIVKEGNRRIGALKLIHVFSGGYLASRLSYTDIEAAFSNSLRKSESLFYL